MGMIVPPPPDCSDEEMSKYLNYFKWQARIGLACCAIAIVTMIVVVVKIYLGMP